MKFSTNTSQRCTSCLIVAAPSVVAASLTMDARDAATEVFAPVDSGGAWVPDRFLRASDFADRLGQGNNPDWKTVGIDEATGRVVPPLGTIGYRWGQKEGEDLGKWNLEAKEGMGGGEVKLALSLIDRRDEALPVSSTKTLTGAGPPAEGVPK